MLAYLFVLLAVAVRLFSGLGYVGTMGFVPLEASLLFFGSRMPRKHFLPPLALLVLTDIYLTTQRYGMKISWEQGIIWAFYLGGLLPGHSAQGPDKASLYGWSGTGLGNRLLHHQQFRCLAGRRHVSTYLVRIHHVLRCGPAFLWQGDHF